MNHLGFVGSCGENMHEPQFKQAKYLTPFHQEIIWVHLWWKTWQWMEKTSGMGWHGVLDAQRWNSFFTAKTFWVCKEFKKIFSFLMVVAVKNIYIRMEKKMGTVLWSWMNPVLTHPYHTPIEEGVGTNKSGTWVIERIDGFCSLPQWNEVHPFANPKFDMCNLAWRGQSCSKACNLRWHPMGQLLGKLEKEDPCNVLW